MGSKRYPGAWLVLPGLAFLTLFYLWPVVSLFGVSFHAVDKYNNPTDELSLSSYVAVFTEGYYYQPLLGSLQMSLEVCVIVGVVGYMVAYAIVRVDNRLLRTVMYAIVVSPLLTSVVARSYGWIILLSNNGVINNILIYTGVLEHPVSMLGTSTATVVSVSQVLLPFATLPIISAFRGERKELETASGTLGCSPATTFLRITLPLTMPGVYVGTILAFTLSMGIYITPLIVGGLSQSVLAIRVYQEIQGQYNVSQGGAISFVLMGSTLTVVVFVSVIYRLWHKKVLG